MNLLHRSVIALSLAGAALAAQAVNVTYDFQVTAQGSLAGTYNGFFSFDDGTIVANGGQATGPGLLTDFSFDFGTVHYDISNTFTGMLSFDSSGLLLDLDIGSDCSGNPTDPCAPLSQSGFAMTNGFFVYATTNPDDRGGFPGSFSLTLREGGGGGGDLPEPASLALVLSAALLAYGSTRRRA